MTTPPPPGFGEPRDVWPLRQEMTRSEASGVVLRYTGSEVLHRLDECHPVPVSASRDRDLLRECRDVLATRLSWSAMSLLSRVDAALTETEK